MLGENPIEMVYSVTPHRANLVLQMLLQANTYVSMVWAMSYMIHMLIRVSFHLRLPPSPLRHVRS